MLKKIYFYKYSDIDNQYFPFKKISLDAFIKNALDLESLTELELPSDISTNTIYNDLISLVLGKYNEHGIIKIVKYFNEEAPSNEEITAAYKNWIYKLISQLNETYEYYTTLLAQYSSAKADLMADIKATSKNKVKFNDTPQNPNSEEVYEGDNYITHFTSTEGENSSPLMSKMMRLKEIQDNYKDLLSTWVRDFERIFFQEDC
ncbi:MAG: hypothetical protein J6T10_16235 [Methanobrevibacter sp.]|nr:hypothetical protein [Methanobrevibacter sp.]